MVNYAEETRKLAIGVDLGQSRDPTTIAALERVAWRVPEQVEHQVMRRGGKYARNKLAEMRAELPRTEYNLRILEPAPLGMPYPAQAELLKGVLRRPNVLAMNPSVWMDYTGVGRAVYDIFRQAGVPMLKPVAITSGGNEGPNGRGGHSVPKLSLVSRLQALMHTGALHVPETMPYARTFRRELLDFRVSYTSHGNATFNALEGKHDDTITAVALAIYGLDGAQEVQVMPLEWAMGRVA